MPNMKSLSLTAQKLKRRLKLTTDKQTGQKQYAPDHSIRGHKNQMANNYFIKSQPVCLFIS